MGVRSHHAVKLHLQPVDEVLCGLVVGVEDQALVAEADQLDVLHLKEEATTGRPDRVLKKPKQRKRKESFTPGKKGGVACFARREVCRLEQHSQIPEKFAKSALRLLKTMLKNISSFLPID